MTYIYPTYEEAGLEPMADDVVQVVTDNDIFYRKLESANMFVGKNIRFCTRLSYDEVKALPKAKRGPHFYAFFMLAYQAGLSAGERFTPEPMTVGGYKVNDGLCGFAWIHIYGRKSMMFGKYLQDHGFAQPDSYNGGTAFWIRSFNQSMGRKEACAREMARVLKEFGITVYAESRLD